MALKVSLTKLLQDPNRAPGIEISINKEVSNLMADGIMDVILETDIPKSHLSSVIRLRLFHKEKWVETGYS